MAMSPLVPPFAMLPVSKAPPSAVAVCVVPPLLRQATFWPTLAVEGFGENDMLPLIPTIVMVTSGPGRGDTGFEDFLLQAVMRPTDTAKSATDTPTTVERLIIYLHAERYRADPSRGCMSEGGPVWQSSIACATSALFNRASPNFR